MDDEHLTELPHASDSAASGSTILPGQKTWKWLGLLLGPVLGGCCLWLLPTEFVQMQRAGPSVAIANERLAGSTDSANISELGGAGVAAVRQFSWGGRATLAVMVWMGVWWLTEAIDISVTALLPIAVFPMLGIATIQDACFPFADPLIFLYFGGFILAISMERWGLGKRIALHTLRVVGTTAPRMVAGFMLVTAGLSAFVSNTATTAMMLPIALSVIGRLRRPSSENGDADQPGSDRFATCLLLGIAYAASIGGTLTIIGTPTNAFLVGFLRDGIAEPFRRDLSFASWLPIGVPFATVFLPLIYLVLTRWLFPMKGIAMVGGRQLIGQELAGLGRVGRGEWITGSVFALTVTLWLFRPWITTLEFQIAGSPVSPWANLSDAGIAMIGAMLLFLIPTDFQQRVFTMDWQHASRIPWGILFLFGGGLSLAAAVQANGVAEFIGSHAASLAALPPIVLIGIVITAIVFLTELTSNAATTASLVPVLAALAPGLGLHPYRLIFPATLAASCAFMLPVATPPNAIVFGTGAITIPQMVRAGFWLNLIAIVILVMFDAFVVRPWLGV